MSTLPQPGFWDREASTLLTGATLIMFGLIIFLICVMLDVPQ